ncbi:MAG: Uma2 family endonuclease [Methylococcales bacterium]
MATVLPGKESPQVERQPVVLHLQPAVELADDQFFEICRINRELRIERNAQGELLIMPPAGGKTSERNAEITMQLRIWAKREGTGVSFDSSGGFVLPNDAVRSPDAAWIRRSRLESLTDEQRAKFIPLCPDFVLELRSPADPLGVFQSKMQEYLDNGAQLGWLIDPEARRIHVYYPGSSVECLEKPDSLTGDPVLAGFVLDLKKIW